MIKYEKKTKLNSGFHSTAFKLDENYILLVGRNKESIKIYEIAKEVSNILGKDYFCLDFPKNLQLYYRSEEYPFGALVYPMIKGDILKNKHVGSNELDAIARKLVEFIEQLHKVEINWPKERTIKNELQNLYKNIKILKNYLSKESFCKLKMFEKDFSDYIIKRKKDFCLTHGDLWQDNLIVDSNNRLIGIIDFGNVSCFLPEVDYASIWNMKDGFLESMIKYSHEDITLESINLFILHREICLFEYSLSDKESFNRQIEIIQSFLSILYNSA